MKLTGWGLTVKNQEFYSVKYITQDFWDDWKHSEGGNDKYKMKNHIDDYKRFRTYWAADPDYVADNYSADSKTGRYGLLLFLLLFSGSCVWH